MKLRSKLFYAYVAFLLVYAGFVLLPAPQQAVLLQYHLSATGLRLIDLTVVLILAVIWFAGFYGFAKLNSYTSLIRQEKDGKQIAKLTKGVFFLVLWLPVSSTLSAILNFAAAKHPGMLPASTIINNYVSLLIPLIGFIFISEGAYGFSGLIRQRPSSRVMHGLAIPLIYIGLIYSHLVITTTGRDMVYHLSLWWVMLTLVAPYIYMWLIGLVATYQIYYYRQKVTGIVYREGWTFLALGICWLVVLSIGFQYLTTLTVHLRHLSIYALLALIYGLLLVLATGFILIAFGARKLQKIEEV